MEVVFMPDAEKDLVFWKSNKAVLKRITQLILSIQQTPFAGIGKPELLKYNFLETGLEE